MAFPTGWGRKCAVVISSAQVSGTSHTDFPVLVTEGMLPSEMLDADGANPALSGGGDIRFSSDSAGATQLACEVVSFVTDNNPALGSAELWVKVPSLSGSVDTTIYVWYNKAGESQPAVTDTYGRNAVWSDYEAVYHLAEAAPSIEGATDSTGNTNLTSVNGTPSSVSGGAIGASALSCGDGAFVYDTAAAAFPGYPFSTQVWHRSPSGIDPSGNDVFTLSDTSSLSEYLTVSAFSSGLGLGGVRQTHRSVGFHYGYASNTTSRLDDTSWHYTSGVFTQDGATLGIDVYHDVFSGNEDIPSADFLDSVRRINIGVGFLRGASSVVGDGGSSEIDEARYRASAFASDWIATEYNNQNSPATFASAGTPESVGGATPTTPTGLITSNITATGFRAGWTP